MTTDAILKFYDQELETICVIIRALTVFDIENGFGAACRISLCSTLIVEIESDLMFTYFDKRHNKFKPGFQTRKLPKMWKKK